MKLRFHLQRGYMNDPNGLVFYKGLYHAFFQTSFGGMVPTEQPTGWGHAVSKDLIHWQQVEDALVPNQPYEKDRGCWSGSAVEKDGRLYAFYTGAARPNASVNVAWSDDGIHFTKYEDNPVIARGPQDGDCWDFRDPKVQKIGNAYHMFIGNSSNNIGRVVRYTSQDLLHWDYAGVLYENAELGPMLECPDFFPLGDRYVLMVSIYTRQVVMIVGQFDGDRFTAERICQPEKGCAFYAAQSFQAPDGRRLLLGWAFETQARNHLPYIGGTTSTRELQLIDGRVHSVPVKELAPYLSNADPCVLATNNSVRILRPDGTEFGHTWDYLHVPVELLTPSMCALHTGGMGSGLAWDDLQLNTCPFEGERPLRYDGPVTNLQVLRSDGLMEVFINDGACNFTFYPDW